MRAHACPQKGLGVKIGIMGRPNTGPESSSPAHQGGGKQAHATTRAHHRIQNHLPRRPRGCESAQFPGRWCRRKRAGCPQRLVFHMAFGLVDLLGHLVRRRPERAKAKFAWVRGARCAPRVHLASRRGQFSEHRSRAKRADARGRHGQGEEKHGQADRHPPAAKRRLGGCGRRDWPRSLGGWCPDRVWAGDIC